jgi:alcohol dehydrogenase (NADP+)
MESSDYFTLNDGNKIPSMGLGTWRIDTEVIYDAIVELGFRHINTGYYYGNEKEIGDVLQKVFNETEIKREDLFITSKLWGTQKDDVEGAIKLCLEKLQLDYVDLYNIHFPVAFKLNEDGTPRFEKIPIYKTWAEMEAVKKEGLAKSIGVSNFNVQTMMDMMTYAEIMPAVNEVELHPYLNQENLVKFCKKYNILPIAYWPLARTNSSDGLMWDEVVKEVAEKYGKTAAQVCLRWGLQRGYPVIPKSSNLKRLKENLESSQFELEQEDFQKISDLNKNYRVVNGSRLPFTLYDDIFA